MRVAPLKEVKDRFSEFIEAAQTSPIVVTRNGKPVVVMSAINNDSDMDTLFLASNSRFIAMLETADARITATGGLKEEDFWGLVGKGQTEGGDMGGVSPPKQAKKRSASRTKVKRHPKPK